MIRSKRYRIMLLGIKIVEIIIDKQEKYNKEYGEKEVDRVYKDRYNDKYAVGGKSNTPDKYKPKHDIDTVVK